MIKTRSKLMILVFLATIVIVPAAVAQNAGPNGSEYGNNGNDGGNGPANGPGDSQGDPQGSKPGRGPGPGPTAGPDAEEGPRARECSVPGLLVDLPLENLSANELKDLAFIREEEKLARDTYLSMAVAWDLRVFRKIARAEKNHIGAVLTIYDKYGLVDGAAANAIGVFEDTGLQDLYGDLVALGSLSPVDAFVVGALVEELDIYDLLMRALVNADNEDLLTLYQNLAKGSRNHLRAFDKLLKRNGVDYEPDYLSTTAYEGIVTSPIEKGVVDANGDWICGGSKKGHFE
jgi:hypothetical protein